jgi:hypothetical protein
MKNIIPINFKCLIVYLGLEDGDAFGRCRDM